MQRRGCRGYPRPPAADATRSYVGGAFGVCDTRAGSSPRESPSGHHGAGKDGGAVELSATEQDLDDADIRLALQEMRREAVPERVHGDVLSSFAACAAA